MSYYFKQNDKDLGPIDERTVIAKLIDGEINSRTLIKDRYEGECHMLQDTDFNAILGLLTARWRYNIGALKREFIYLMFSLGVWLVPLVTYLGGLFNSEVRSFLLHYGVMGVFGFFSFAGFFSSCYFAWVFAYRLWRVVPKSMYKVTPGWRIMLTFIPFFRFGWNYCMWLPLAEKLRTLTNYSLRTGRTAAYFYCSGVISLALSLYSVTVLPWSYSLLNGKYHEALWENLLGFIFLVLLLLSFVITVGGFIVMTYKLKKAALAILRHRYAYNVCIKTKNSLFLENILKRQRHYDKVHRWGHGLGIGGVLVGWPLMLIGIPVLILFIVGSCRYDKSCDKLDEMGMPSSLFRLYAAANVSDNALEDVRKIDEGDSLKAVFSHNSLVIHADWHNIDSLVDSSDVEAIKKLSRKLENDITAAVNAQNAVKYIVSVRRYDKFIGWMLSSPVPELYDIGNAAMERVLDIVMTEKAEKLNENKEAAAVLSDFADNASGHIRTGGSAQFMIRILIDEKRFRDAPLPFPPPDNPRDFWLHVYKMTPFMYFSRNDALRKGMIIADIWRKKGPATVTADMMEQYQHANCAMSDDFYKQQTGLLKKTVYLEHKLKNIFSENNK